MTIIEAVQKAKKCLEDSNVPDCGIDALILLQSVCGIDRAGYYARGDEELPGELAQRYFEKIVLRAEHIPLQQITGEQYFCGLRFLVNEHVLCPRPETELLVEEALSHVESGSRILDLCTGSGCIAVSLLCLGQENLSHQFHGKKMADQELFVCACDLSEAALEVARTNAELNHVSDRMELLQSDLYDKVQGKYDIIVSNPPYIASRVIASLMPEVRDHEPHMALDGGADGLDFYRRIVDKADGYLKENGWLSVEIGFDQGECVRSMFVDHGYDSVQVMKDLAGLDRVVTGRYKGVPKCLTS